MTFDRAQRHLLAEDSLGWGIVGASSVAGEWMVDAIRSQEALVSPIRRQPATNSWVAGIFSHNENRARHFADHCQIPYTYLNLADLLAQPQVHCIYVGGHVRHRAQVVLAALAAGKHVLCETPMALNLADAQRMAHTAAEKNLVLAVNYAYRADPAIQRTRDLLADRALGDLLGGRISHTRLLPIHLHTWRLRPNGGGVVFDHTAHDIDLLRFLFRDEIASVVAAETQRLLGDEVEEDVMVWATMRRSKLTIQIYNSFLVPHIPTALELYGSTAMLRAEHALDHERQSELFLSRHNHQSTVSLEPGHPYRASVQAFVSAVRGQGNPLASATDGVQSLRAVLAVHEAIRQGRRILIDYQPRLRVDYSIT